MRNTLLTTGAVVALFVAPAFAQDAEAPKPAEQPGMTETVPAPDVAIEPAEIAPPAMTAETPRFITLEAATQLLASNLIGQNVYNAAGESLGNVNDILLDDVESDTGSVVAVIVGVGGFLGIGEKNVAISFDALTQQTDADGNRMIVLDTTADELNNAPAFTTSDEADAGAPVVPAPTP